jgi:hypothetical protein
MTVRCHFNRLWKMHSSRKQRTEENTGRADILTNFEIPPVHQGSYSTDENMEEIRLTQI